MFIYWSYVLSYVHCCWDKSITKSNILSSWNNILFNGNYDFLGLWHKNFNNMGYCCIIWGYLPPEEIMQKHLGYICEKASGYGTQYFMSKWHIINKFYFTFPWVFSYCIKWERSKDFLLLSPIFMRLHRMMTRIHAKSFCWALNKLHCFVWFFGS